MTPTVGWGDAPTRAAAASGNGSSQKATAGWLSMLSVFEPHWQVWVAGAWAAAQLICTCLSWILLTDGVWQQLMAEVQKACARAAGCMLCTCVGCVILYRRVRTSSDMTVVLDEYHDVVNLSRAAERRLLNVQCCCCSCAISPLQPLSACCVTLCAGSHGRGQCQRLVAVGAAAV